MMLLLIILGGLLSAASPVSCAGDSVWQWTVPVGESRARLWIPEKCATVRAVLFAQHDMIERSILEHPEMRRTLAENGMAAVFRFDQGAGERFESIMKALAVKVTVTAWQSGGGGRVFNAAQPVERTFSILP